MLSCVLLSFPGMSLFSYLPEKMVVHVIRKLCYQQMNIGGLECCFTIGGGKKTGTKIAGRLYFLKFVCRNIFFYLLKR